MIEINKELLSPDLTQKIKNLELEVKEFRYTPLDKIVLEKSTQLELNGLRYILISPDDVDFVFIYDITQSKKNHFKLTLYLLEGETKIGLLRVDYNGQHINSEILTDKVPEVFHPYVGKFFDYHEHHIRYYVKGCKTTSDWVLPLTFEYFNKIISLQTIFKINSLLL